MSVVYIGIGSNLGDRKQNIETALEKLRSRKNIEVKEVSSIIETEPVGDITQPKFLNACCRLETILYPDELLEALKSVEKEMGRDKDSGQRRLSPQEQLRMLQEGKDIDIGDRFHISEPRQRNLVRPPHQLGGAHKPVAAYSQQHSPLSGPSPRTIDLDILFYDDVVMKGINLIIPHPRLHERLFVLRPLSEIAPDFIHPVLKKSIKDLLFDFRVEYESS